MDEKILAIDAWGSRLPPEVTKYWPPEFTYIFRLYGATEKMLKGYSLEEMIEEMDEAGVEKVVLSAFVYQDMRVTNEMIATWVEQFPDRFVGSATVDPRNGMDAVRELDMVVNDLGLRALKLEPYAYGDGKVGLPPNHKYYYPIYAKCIELDIPVTIQVGHTGPLLPSECARPIYLDEVALHFPELRIIGGHLGQPWHEEMMILAWKHPNVYIDTSARTPKRWPRSFVQFVRSWGQDKVLWGTDYPLLQFKRCIDEIENLGLPPEARRKVLRENAIKVFKIK